MSDASAALLLALPASLFIVVMFVRLWRELTTPREGSNARRPEVLRALATIAREELGPGFHLVDAPLAPIQRLRGAAGGRAAWVEMSTLEVGLGVELHVPVEPHVLDRRTPSAAGRALVRLERIGFRCVAVAGGHAITSSEESLRSVIDWREVLELLVAVAQSLEPEPTPIALQVDARASSLRCAYCHQDLTPDEPELIQCDRCRTVLHEGCREELGRCPALGCDAPEPERARTA